ncbi:MAG: hypothetical protein SV765_17305, partial [Pseudomonadota bacterium]|nr:hypothetical protein [Pseudomonadota bacterium]
MKKYLLAAFLTFATSAAFAADSITGKVVRVADGDTITILTSVTAHSTPYLTDPMPRDRLTPSNYGRSQSNAKPEIQSTISP